MARPVKLDGDKLRVLEELAYIQCTYREIANLMGIHEDTLFKNKYYSSLIEKGRERGKTSLRRAMFKSALGGNVVMQIWLSKQLLGHSDKAVVDTNNRVSLTLNYKLPQTTTVVETTTTEYTENEEVN